MSAPLTCSLFTALVLTSLRAGAVLGESADVSDARLRAHTAQLEKALAGRDAAAVAHPLAQVKRDLGPDGDGQFTQDFRLSSRLQEAVDAAANPLPPDACPAGAPLQEAQVNTAGVQSYLAANAQTIRTPDDLVCCLPASYRRHYAIFHDSVAGRSSDAFGPRVLLYNAISGQGGPDQLANPLRAVISINGGGERLNNHGNVELMFNNRTKQEVEYSDFNFANGRAEFGGVNPTSCLACHGTDGRAGVGGPRTIFDPSFKWIRAVGGSPPGTPGERELLDAVLKATKKAIVGNPRYRCLGPLPDGDRTFDAPAGGINTSPRLKELDRVLSDLNDRRLSQLVRGTPDFAKYRMAIVGTMECDAATDGFRGWIPDAALARHRSTEFLMPEVARSRDLPRTALEIYQRQDRENALLAQAQPRMAAALRAGRLAPYRFSTNAMMAFDRTAGGPDGASAKLAARLTRVPLLNRFIVDSSARGFVSPIGFDPGLRFLLEGRGVDLGAWSMDATPYAYQRAPLFLSHYLIDNDGLGSPLHAFGDRLAAADTSLYPEFEYLPPPRMTIDEFGRYSENQRAQKAQACEQLKADSLRAFSNEK